MGPDWSLLPSELLELISEKITSIDHYVHFRSVCWPWRKSSTPYPRHLIPPFPWLMLDFREKGPSFSTLSFYDFSKSKIHDIELPGVNWKDVCGHSRGWIVLEKDKELSFVNPITRETKSGCFPSLAVPPKVLEFARNEKTTNRLPFQGTDHSIITKVILTSSPCDRDCIVVAEFSCSEWELGFSRIGDSCWTILKLDYGLGGRSILDFKCRNNLVYAIDKEDCLIVYDLRDLSKKIIIDTISAWNGHLRLVIGEAELDGIPLLVKHDYREGYEVFKCMGCKWRKVRNIGNVVLLLNDTACEIVSLGNSPLNGWEGNRICFEIINYDNINYPLNRSQHRFFSIEIRMKSVENGGEKVVPTSLGLLSSDRVGSLSWFTPSLY